MRRLRSERQPFDADHSPRTLVLLHRLLALDELERVRDAIVEGVQWLGAADTVALWEPTENGNLTPTARRGAEPGAPALELERRLVELPGPARSTLERHTNPTLQRLSEQCRSEGRLCQVRPLNAFGSRVGSVAFHCYGRAELTLGEMQALRQFSDAAAIALRSAYEREELRQLAYTDPLTGLPNRRRIGDVLAAASPPFSLLFVDFDGLKAVNDSLGYEAGDEVVRAIGSALHAVTAPERVAGRLGGDEFAVVLLGADAERARAEAAALEAALGRVTVPAEAAAHFRGASVGWAAAASGEEPGALLRRAAVAMRGAKRERRLQRGDAARPSASP